MTKRKDGRSQESLTINGKRKYFYGHSKREVLQKIREYKEQYESGTRFEDVADAWWEVDERTLSPGTVKSYTPALRRAKEYFDTTIDDIDPSDIYQYLDSLKRKQYSQKSVRNHYMVLNQILRYAVETGFLASNPARDISIPKGLPRTTRGIPSDEDIEKIKQTTDQTMGMFAYWIMYTGCRRSELLALEWSDVDVDTRTITINKSRYQLNNKLYIKEPKTAAGYRVLPLMDKLLEKIHRKNRGLVFPYNGQMYTERRFELDWNAYCKRNGIHCTPHMLRHCYATMLYENNVDIKDAQILLGHAQASTTLDVYTHIRDRQKAAVRNRLLGADINSTAPDPSEAAP